MLEPGWELLLSLTNIHVISAPIFIGINSSRACPALDAGNPVLSADGFIQVIPEWISLFYQYQLPCSFRFLYLFLPFDSRLPGFVGLIPNQFVNFVSLRETVDKIVFVFVDTLNKTRGHACIKGAIPFATKNVDVKLFQMFPLDSRFRGNDFNIGGEIQKMVQRDLTTHKSHRKYPSPIMVLIKSVQVIVHTPAKIKIATLVRF